MNKPGKTYPRPIGELVGPCLGDVFAKRGFASGALLTQWPEIVGTEIAAYAEPFKLQWPRGTHAAEDGEAATLVLRVEGPAAIEIQHLAPIILERVNRFLGWRAVARLSIRQAPLPRRKQHGRRKEPDPEAVAAVAAQLPAIEAEPLRDALARLGAAIKR